MTQEEKQLLLKDLCARLPYNVIVDKDGHKCVALTITGYGEVEIEIATSYFRYYDISDLRPYLRPMSSMTEEEREYVESLSDFHCTPDVARDKIDFYLENHIDFRGLIKKGLALEAPEGMYKTDLL